ncbi:MAG: class II aldolase/adducin family protein [Chloroflexi bacterium]|nr:MAG: class II aldolase/adducin family protein [Chloroflexota bacterium]
MSQVRTAPSLTHEAADRALVALACRVMAAAGLFDMHGHISLRDGDVAYINGRRSSRISVTPAQVAVVNIADGAVVSGEPPAETPLHLGCYRARPEIRRVAHFHPLAATAFATVGKPLITAFNAGAPFGKVVPVYDDPDLVRNGRPELRDAVALPRGEREAPGIRDGHRRAEAVHRRRDQAGEREPVAAVRHREDLDRRARARAASRRSR